MMHRRKAAAPFGAILVLLLAALVMAAPAGAAQLHDGVPYRSGLQLDIHSPGDRPVKQASLPGLNLFSFGATGGRSRAPVVIYAHGGGWVKGSRKKVYSQAEWLTSRGYVFVAIDYRKVPQTTVEGQAQDLASAISWVRSNIGRYGGDPARIVLMGHSAGAHLVSMVAARKMGGNLRGVIANDVQAYDMVAYAGMRGSLGYPYINAFGSDPSDWVRWSPVTYARQGSGYPPHMFLHSGSNGERRRALTNGYANILRSRGTSVTVFDGHRYTHGTIARHLGRPGDAATAAIEQFLARVTR